ncbi:MULTISPECIES: rubrerythrin [unclassified Oscillibacter]|uniref:rubrerythrin n=1 Tax=unclassified Oscillibacter TaxID=2629304 RepID=UPI0025F50454|nr:MULTISPECIES: rubrerythrin family protein [unclassified Oscillibacter]
MDLKNSETKISLMRAFAGESQARNRYTFAASQAKKQGLHVIEAAFLFTANQEKEHAEVFYKHLGELSGETVQIDGGYPVDAAQDMAALLRMARHNELEEFGDAYPAFAEIAKKEGFSRIADSFSRIAAIEKTHADRFELLADLLERERLFVADVECGWMCLNCGYVFTGKTAPEKCPACDHDRGYFIRLTMAPYTEG